MDRTLAPLASLSTVVPSLESTPAKSLDLDFVVPIDKSEVKFQTDSISSASSSSSETDEDKPKIPDGGWGWVVVFASLLISMIADGISFSIGHLHVKFLEEFEASNSVTSWIGSLFIAVPLLTGPIMSVLVDRYGCRPMTIVGGIISAVGFCISSKAESIGVMYLTFGVLAGLGLGLIYVTAVVSIAFWFDKKRTLAVGLGASGTGLGTFIFSPLTSFLISEYGWRGTSLILGGCFLNMCVAGALMRDPDWITEQNCKSKSMKSDKSSKTSLVSVSSANPANFIDINELKSLLKSGKDVEFLLQKLETSMDNEDKDKLKRYVHSVLSLPTFVKENEKVPLEVLEQLSLNKKLYNVILENYPSLILCRSSSAGHELNKMPDAPMDRIPVTVSLKLKKQERPKLTSEKPKSPPLQQHSLPEQDTAAHEPLLNGKNPPPVRPNVSFPWLKQAQRPHYLKNLKLHRQSLIHRGGAMFNINKYRFKASSCPNIYRVSMMTLPEKDDEKWYTEIIGSVKGMFGYSLFLELHFFLLSLSTITLFVWFIVPYFYLAELMPKYQYTNKQISLTISNIGATNTIGMILLGWAGDQDWMNITKTYAVCLVLCGISCAGIIFFIDNYIMLQVSAAMFGLFLSSSFSFTPGILVELLPLERFTIAYGLQLLCMGIGTLVGPPFAGLLYDLTSSWEQSFYQAAIWIVLSGIFIAYIPYTRNKKILGKGAVEKELEESENNVIFLIFLTIALVIMLTLVAYMIVTYLT
ncbi:monocarboxylate transporter 14-like [Cylas formicarius]|uniref:monocarboxylate transporter 14-like n=1 Tax=Cylas formicarius TaxID=197179 RepID=UPI002958DAEB|nr:monocarboxylate transporter 14-like [Cylas formicarius]